MELYVSVSRGVFVHLFLLFLDFLFKIFFHI